MSGGCCLLFTVCLKLTLSEGKQVMKLSHTQFAWVTLVRQNCTIIPGLSLKVNSTDLLSAPPAAFSSRCRWLVAVVTGQSTIIFL